ncbi:hypothetical protein MMC25_002214 [Agyrium rufum]|nr:hypothetical protein [Agyrium rufum]
MERPSGQADRKKLEGKIESICEQHGNQLTLTFPSSGEKGSVELDFLLKLPGLAENIKGNECILELPDDEEEAMRWLVLYTSESYDSVIEHNPSYLKLSNPQSSLKSLSVYPLAKARLADVFTQAYRTSLRYGGTSIMKLFMEEIRSLNLQENPAIFFQTAFGLVKGAPGKEMRRTKAYKWIMQHLNTALNKLALTQIFDVVESTKEPSWLRKEFLTRILKRQVSLASKMHLSGVSLNPDPEDDVVI